MPTWQTFQERSMLDVVELTSLEALREYRLVWHMLRRKNPKSSYFQSREWIDAYVRRFCPEDELRVLVISFAGQPVGIVPLVLKRQTTRLGLTRVLSTMGTERFGSKYPIGADQAATMFGVAQYLADRRDQWDLLQIPGIDHNGDDEGRTGNALRIHGLRPSRREGGSIGVINLNRWHELRGIHRVGDLHRAEKELQKYGEVTFIRHRTQLDSRREIDLRRDLLESVLEMVADRSPENADFLRDVYEGAALAGMLDMNVLLVGGRPAAFAMNVHQQGVLENIVAGGLADWHASARLSLVERILLDSRDRNDTEWRFGARQREWVGDYVNRLVPTIDWTCIAGTTPRYQMIRLQEWCKNLWSPRFA